MRHRPSDVQPKVSETTQSVGPIGGVVRVNSRVLATVAALVFLGGCSVRTETHNMVGGGDDWLSPSVLVGVPGAIKDILGLAGLMGSLAGNVWLGRKVLDHRAKINKGPILIFAGINAKLEIALRATGPAAISAAHDLVDCVQLYLGPLLAFTTDVGKPYEQLRKALAGKVKKPDATTIKVDHDRPAGPVAAAAAAAAGGAAASVAVAGTHVAVEAPPSPPPPPPPPAERDASTQEQMVEVRLALEAFARVWTRASIEQKLRRAQQSLLITKAICASNAVEDPCA